MILMLERQSELNGINLRLSGALDTLSAPSVRHELDDIVNSCPRHVVIDLSDVWRLDSSGVALIVSLYKRVRSQNGEVRVVGVHGQPEAIFRLLQLDRVFLGSTGECAPNAAIVAASTAHDYPLRTRKRWRPWTALAH